MNKKILSSILLSSFLFSNSVVFAQTASPFLGTTTEENIVLSKKIENEIQNAIISIYGDQKAPEIYKKVRME